VRLILNGLFDRYPKLTVILGHLGEALPFGDATGSAHRNTVRIGESIERETIVMSAPTVAKQLIDVLRQAGSTAGIVNLFGPTSGGDQSSAWLRWDGRVRSGGSGGGGQPGDVVPGTEAADHLAAVFLGMEQVTTGPEMGRCSTEASTLRRAAW
jgi:hypothetical protein